MKREFADFIRNAPDDEKEAVYACAMDKVHDWQQQIIRMAKVYSDRRTHLCKNAPSCPKCETKQVQLFLGASIPAEWKCRHCKQYFPFEPLAIQTGKE